MHEIVPALKMFDTRLSCAVYWINTFTSVDPIDTDQYSEKHELTFIARLLHLGLLTRTMNATKCGLIPHRNGIYAAKPLRRQVEAFT